MRIPRSKQREAKRFIAHFIEAKALESSAFEDENGDEDEVLKAAVLLEIERLYRAGEESDGE